MPRKAKGVYLKYDAATLQKALASVRDGKFFGAASKEFGIPKSTLRDHMQGRSSVEVRPGRKRSIPEELENQVVDKVIAAAQAGFPITKRQFLMKVGMLAKKMKLNTMFKNDVPGDDYWRCLKARRPDLVIRTAESCGINRMKGTTRTVVNKYFDDLEKIVTQMDLSDKPDRIWNCDETGLQFSPNPGKVLAKKGTRELLARSSNSQDSVTTLVCINAAEAAMPPFCVVKGKTMRSVQSFSTQNGPADALWTYQENAWMCEVLGVEWFSKVFLNHCGPERPQLLVLDSHGSHEVVELLDLARQNSIHIIALPPHTTHVLQPLDRVVFGPFKRAYRRACTEYLSESPDNTINKVSWPGLLKKTWEEAMRKTLIQKAFEASGIVPLNRGRIPDSVFSPSEPFCNNDEDDATATFTLPAATTTSTLPSATATSTLPSATATSTLPSTTATSTLPSATATCTLPAATATSTLPAATATSTLPAATATSTLPAATATSTLPAATTSLAATQLVATLQSAPIISGDFVPVRDISNQELLEIENISAVTTIPFSNQDISFLNGLQVEVEGSADLLQIDLFAEGVS